MFIASQENKNAQISCEGQQPKNATPCGGKTHKPCLFNIAKDPCEFQDVSELFPDIYDKMLKKLQNYRDTMVKARQNTSTDPDADPRKRNGVWLPWKLLPREDDISSIVDSVQSPFSLMWVFLF